MDGYSCYHCKAWVPAGAAHDCWTTTEGALTRDLPEDLRDAWDRLRETVAEFGEQRIYASHNSIMFARSVCYAFVRPRPTRLEICVFLGRTVKAPQVKRATPASRVKVAHMVHVRHRDEVEAPLTDWLREAYERCDELRAKGRSAAATDAPSRKSVTAKRPSAAPGRSPTRRSAKAPAKPSARVVKARAPRRSPRKTR